MRSPARPARGSAHRRSRPAGAASSSACHPPPRQQHTRYAGSIRLSSTLWLALLVACGGGDDGADGAADAEPACAPPVGTYETEALAGKGTCDPDRLLPGLVPL